MTNLTLKQLRYIVALARHGHFGRAADDCAISQPALSMQIREAEAILGLPLFERGTRRAVPTAFGIDIVAHAKDILDAVDTLGDLARSARGVFQGRLRLGVIPTIAPYLLPRVMSALSRRYPDLDLRIRESQTTRLLKFLHDSEIDCALLALPVSEPSLVEYPIMDEPFFLVRPKSEAHIPVPDREGLQLMRLLLLEEGHCFRDQALAFCNQPRARPHGAMEASSLSTLVQMVAAGMGVTLLPQMAVRVETGAAQVAVTRFDPPEPTRSVGLVWRKSSPLGSDLTKLVDVLRDILDISH